MAEQQVRKLREEHLELKGEDVGKEVMRGPEADVRSITAEAACNRGQGGLWVAGWEGPVRDPAKKHEEAEWESKEERAWECVTAGKGLEDTVGVAMSKKEQEAMQTVTGIKGESWADESMEPATQPHTSHLAGTLPYSLAIILFLHVLFLATAHISICFTLVHVCSICLPFHLRCSTTYSAVAHLLPLIPSSPCHCPPPPIRPAASQCAGACLAAMARIIAVAMGLLVHFLLGAAISIMPLGMNA
ncbi:unnamed protein product, partial [Closterium sp. NIES-65]